MHLHLDFPELSVLPSVDAEYRFGRPKVYLSPRELARLTIVRSRLGDTPAERQATAAGLRAGAPAVTPDRPAPNSIQARN